ncbi:AraC family transcriptional regulator [Vagococcus elongatus]|nr:AraC family transcriptional regulator [Vagococcus elongatus]
MYLKEVAFHGEEFFHFSIYKLKILDNRQLIINSHWHEEMEFLYVEKGNVTIYINDSQFVVGDQTLIYLPSQVIHSVRNHKDGDKSIYSLVFSADLIGQKELKESIFNHSLMSTAEIINLDNDIGKKIQNILYQTIEAYSTHHSESEFLIRGNLFHIFHYMFQSADKFFSQSVFKEQVLDYKKEFIVKYIRENYQDDIRLKDISQKLNISAEHFSRIFKNYFGCNFSKYLMKYRISKATLFLKTTKLAIIDIAVSCGFKSSSYFSACFKKEMGISPQKYRKKYTYL